MNIIVAADKNWAIGKDNGLLWHLPQDMKFFRETTTGHAVIMGRKTLDSFPGGRALRNRINIVITREPEFSRDGVIAVHSREEALELVASMIKDGRELILKDKEGNVTGVKTEFTSDDFYVIGGESIYRMLLDDCDRAYVTRVDAEYEADTWFPDLDADPAWELTARGETMEHEGVEFAFTAYEKK